MTANVFRKATIDDVEAVTRILRTAADRMLAEGKHQWTRDYPARPDVEADIAAGTGYVLVAGSEIAGYGAVILTGEPAYDALDGRWLSDMPYVVVHRIAILAYNERRGLGTELLHHVEELAQRAGIHSFRIDTNYDNERMLGLLQKTGFTYCGEVKYKNGPRKAFEKVI